MVGKALLPKRLIVRSRKWCNSAASEGSPMIHLKRASLCMGWSACSLQGSSCSESLSVSIVNISDWLLSSVDFKQWRSTLRSGWCNPFELDEVAQIEAPVCFSSSNKEGSGALIFFEGWTPPVGNRVYLSAFYRVILYLKELSPLNAFYIFSDY